MADKASVFWEAGTISSRTPLQAGAVPDASGRMMAAAQMCALLLENTRRATRHASTIMLVQTVNQQEYLREKMANVRVAEKLQVECATVAFVGRGHSVLQINGALSCALA